MQKVRVYLITEETMEAIQLALRLAEDFKNSCRTKEDGEEAVSYARASRILLHQQHAQTNTLMVGAEEPRELFEMCLQALTRDA